MARERQVLAGVAVIVRAGAAPLVWAGLLGAGIGALLPGMTGRRIGLSAGAVLFLAGAAVVLLVRRRRYVRLADDAVRAARTDLLQDRDVTLRAWRRARRWWVAGAFLAAVGTSFVLPGAGGLLLAGIGAGLWAKALWLGHREVAGDRLLWVPVSGLSRGGAPVGKGVDGFRATGIAAGDAVPGGARRRR
ncbi:hypothetical protein I3F58_02175 [Streptomyces sp. MUM 203J]|uniref:hypothetical protein n=1 Tax=Streptomyces sp. MUM 203J TaxID=2791990 RepID=UPI001F04F209|nr:hypothetical protein [Streptomyces sp. MUM 203J]MCH0538386.1 hypothetical protein [Streptomyces sp. MUM 203J]